MNEIDDAKKTVDDAIKLLGKDVTELVRLPAPLYPHTEHRVAGGMSCDLFLLAGRTEAEYACILSKCTSAPVY